MRHEPRSGTVPMPGKGVSEFGFRRSVASALQKLTAHAPTPNWTWSALVLGSLLPGLPQRLGPALPRPLAFKGVTVIGSLGLPPQSGQVLVLQGSRIVAVGPVARVPIPAGANQVDGRGLFVIPGLWDMHVQDRKSVV